MLFRSLLISSASALLTEPCDVNHGVLYEGNTIASKPVMSASECCQLCTEEQGCRYWTFDILSEEQLCLLMDSNGGRKLTNMHVSGSRAGKTLDTKTLTDKFGDNPYPVLLGLDYFQKGIEAIKDTINRTQHIRLPVYKYNFAGQKSWHNPYDQVMYSIPDELSLTNNPAGFEEIDDSYTMHYSQSITEITKSSDFSATIDIKFPNIGTGGDAGVTYEDNKQWWQYSNEQREQENYVSHSIMWWRYWELMAYPMEILGDKSIDPMFKMFVTQKLPSEIKSEQDAKQYDMLIQNWGTHYVSWANYGGRLNLDVFTDNEFNSKQTAQFTSEQHSLSFHFNLFDIDASAKIAGFTNKSQIHIDKNFLNHSRTFTYFEGGDPALMSTTSLQAWLDSVKTAPHWLNSTMKGLWTLPFVEKAIAKTMQAYMYAYFKNATGGGK